MESLNTKLISFLYMCKLVAKHDINFSIWLHNFKKKFNVILFFFYKLRSRKETLNCAVGSLRSLELMLTVHGTMKRNVMITSKYRNKMKESICTQKINLNDNRFHVIVRVWCLNILFHWKKNKKMLQKKINLKDY